MSDATARLPMGRSPDCLRSGRMMLSIVRVCTLVIFRKTAISQIQLFCVVKQTICYQKRSFLMHLKFSVLSIDYKISLQIYT